MSKRLLVTGVSSGIGLELARHALSLGHAVDALNRREPTQLLGMDAFRFQSADFSELETLTSVVEEFIGEGTHYDYVVLNAGVLSDIADMRECSMESIERVMRVNVWSNKVLLDALLARSSVSQVVAISSGAAVSGSRGWNAYSLSKATLNMLVKLYASECLGVHFSALAPGLVDTAMQETIYNLPADERFSKMDDLKAARGTSAMPLPSVFAPRLLEVFDLLKSEHSSGAFVDIRNL